MLKDILTKLGVNFAEDISDEDAEKLINETIDAKNEHINSLEAEKETLSKTNEDLTASVEGIKADKEKLDKDLSVANGKLDQLTQMYKEQFSKPVDEQETIKKPDLKKVSNDALQFILEAK